MNAPRLARCRPLCMASVLGKGGPTAVPPGMALALAVVEVLTGQIGPASIEVEGILAFEILDKLSEEGYKAT